MTTITKLALRTDLWLMALLMLLWWKQIKLTLSSQEALHKEKVCPFSRIQDEEQIKH